MLTSSVRTLSEFGEQPSRPAARAAGKRSLGSVEEGGGGASGRAVKGAGTGKSSRAPDASSLPQDSGGHSKVPGDRPMMPLGKGKEKEKDKNEFDCEYRGKRTASVPCVGAR